MELGYKGKTAFVTGAGSPIGFGRQICLTLAGEGCNIAAADVNIEGVRETAALCKALGVEAEAYEVDVTKRTTVDTAVAAAMAKFGRIDLLVNNAGATAEQNRPFIEMEKERNWDFDINVNLYGQMNMAQEIAKCMVKDGKGGKIINFAGGRGLPGLASYGAAKGGVIEFSMSLALELAPAGVSVNVFQPGLARTGLTKTQSEEFMNMITENMTVQKRLNTPEDVANIIAFMGSDKNNYMSGVVINLG